MLALVFALITLSPYMSFEWAVVNPPIDTANVKGRGYHTIYHKNLNGVFIGSLFEKGPLYVDVVVGAVGSGLNLDKPYLGGTIGIERRGLYFLGSAVISGREGLQRGFRGIVGYRREVKNFVFNVSFERGREEFKVFTLDSIIGLDFRDVVRDTCLYSSYYSELLYSLTYGLGYFVPSLSVGFKKYDFGRRFNLFATFGITVGRVKTSHLKTSGAIQKTVGRIYAW